MSETPRVGVNGWGIWSKYVLKELERQDGVLRELRGLISTLSQGMARRNGQKEVEDERHIAQRVQVLEKQMTRMQVKAGIWGAIGAAIPVIAGYLLTR